MERSMKWAALAVLVALCISHASAAAGPPGNTKKGKGALSKNTGANNTAVGFQAMDPSAQCTGPATPNVCCTGAGKGTCGNSGDANTAVGTFALSSNTTGVFNTAVGVSALVSNTTASYNTAVGLAALSSNTTGAANSGRSSGVMLVIRFPNLSTFRTTPFSSLSLTGLGLGAAKRV